MTRPRSEKAREDTSSLEDELIRRLERVRSSDEPGEEILRITGVLKSFLGKHSLGGRLPGSELTDMAEDVLMEALPAILSRSVPPEKAARTIGESLSRAHRRRLREMERKPPGVRKAGDSLEDRIASIDEAIHIVRRVERHMVRALESLAAKDHDVIVDAHNLDRVGIPKRTTGALEYSTPAARDRALNRATLKLRNALTSLLRKEAGPEPRDEEILATMQTVETAGLERFLLAVIGSQGPCGPYMQREFAGVPIPAKLSEPLAWRPGGARPDSAFVHLIPELHDGSTGRLDAGKVGAFFGLTISDVARILKKSIATVHKTSNAPGLQSGLAMFERIAAALMQHAGSAEGARIWINAPNPDLEERTPLALIREGKAKIVAELLEDALMGHPG